MAYVPPPRPLQSGVQSGASTPGPSQTTLLARECAWFDAHLSPPIEIFRPVRQTVPVVFCSPHSGRSYPQPFVETARLDALSLRRSEDAFVDRLFARAVKFGAPMILARFPRAFVDVNREPYELDPRLIDGPLPPGANTQSARVAGGLGTVPRLVADGEDIYRGRLPVDVVLQRIDRLYLPFHQALDALLGETFDRFGTALLVDCHSMPSASVGQGHGPKAQFVIGDRFGTSCAPEITRAATRTCGAAGVNVQVNRPYAGGFITEHYGRPQDGVHALQIEINRALYLNEATLEPNERFDGCVAMVDKLIETLTELADSWACPRNLAAE